MYFCCVHVSCECVGYRESVCVRVHAWLRASKLFLFHAQVSCAPSSPPSLVTNKVLSTFMHLHLPARVSTGRLSHVFCQLRDGEQGGIVSSSDAVFLQVGANIYIFFLSDIWRILHDDGYDSSSQTVA